MANDAVSSSSSERRYEVWRARFRWFAAEFLVVVTGVLVALTIGAWWEARREHELEQSYLQRLLVDLGADSVEFDNHLSVERNRHEQARLLLSVLSGTKPSDPSALLYAVEEAGIAYFFRLSPYTFKELQATGNLRLIRDPDIRNALTAYYYQSIDGGQLIYDYERDRAWAYVHATSGVLPPETRVAIALQQPVDTNDVAAVISRLAAVPNVRALTSEVLTSTSYMEFNLNYLRDLQNNALKRVRGALAER